MNPVSCVITSVMLHVICYMLYDNNMNDCLFCKIISGEIPSQKVYEDEDVLAFLDINPIAPGHVQLIPKAHFLNMAEASGESLRSLISVAPKIAKAICESLDYKGYNFTTNNGGVAGQEVMHLHFHIIPRKKDDGHPNFIRGGYEDGQMEEIALKIKKTLSAKGGYASGVK